MPYSVTAADQQAEYIDSCISAMDLKPSQQDPGSSLPVPQWYLDIPNLRPRPKNAPPLASPPGYTDATVSKRSSSSKTPTRKPPTTAETDTLKLKKSWEIALAPAKALPMNAIMMYMSGNSLQIFSIMMVFMLFKNPVVGLFQVNEAFRRYESPGNKDSMLAVKGCYVLMQLLALGLGVWKVNGMGLLPTTTSDWLAWESQSVPLERTIFAL